MIFSIGVLSLLAKITAAVVMGLVATWFARRSRASLRHAILVITFGGLLLLPLASSFAPPLNIPVAVAGQPDQTADVSVPPPTSESDTPIAESSVQGSVSGGALSRSLVGASLLFAIWLLGTGLFLVPVAIGLRQTRAVRRTGTAWRGGQILADSLVAETRGGRRVEVRFHEGLSGPATFGVIRPVILFPPDAAAWNNEDVTRAMVHELEHVQRVDRAWHTLATVACAVYWFHPLVWVALRRLSLEAEKSCDDAVLARWESAGYADQLVAVARRSASEPYALAMASRSNLAARVYAMLDRSQHRGRAGVRAVVLSCCAAALLVTGLSVFRLVAAPQAPASRKPMPLFDVVSVKPARSDLGGSWNPFPVNGTWSSKAMVVENIVAYAYGVDRNRVEGVPKALQGLDGFDIVAKMPLETSREDFFLMMQSLLAERFKAVVQTEVRDIPVKTISVAKGGLKLLPASGQCVEVTGNASLPAGQHRCHEVEVGVSASFDRTVTWEYSGRSVSMADLARGLSRAGLVVDDTGLRGLYDFHVKIKMRPGQDAVESQINAESATRDAWEKQAGLIFDQKTKKRPGTVVVVDHIEFPSPN